MTTISTATANDSPLFDETERRILAEASLRSITLSTSRAQGEEFFQVLVKDLAAALDVCYVLAGELVEVDGVESSHTLAVWGGTDFIPNMTYPLLHTPCSNVADQSMCFHSCDIQQEYPLDALLVDMKAESYIGMPMVGTDGRTLGILAALDTRPIDENKRLLALSLLSIFSARAAAELQHRRREDELEALVEKRTSALVLTQNLLVQKEKLAALGSLVAGVAHAINTPIGNALTTASTISELSAELTILIHGEKISRQRLNEVTQRLCRGAQLVEHNLNRASDLVGNFRMLADTQESDSVIELNLNNCITSIGAAHQLELKKRNAQVLTSIVTDLIVRLPVGMLSQIISNLVANSLLHGFEGRNAGTICISAHRDGPQYKDLLLSFSDDGIGASAEVRKHLFEPFFTTRLGQGGSGLGMHIVYTLMQRLSGTIELLAPDAGGLQLQLRFPDCVV